jgi:single-stranded-DNA-specific exonuclease
VGLGTIADVVPLTGENRILARLGLNAIRTSARPGIKALMEVAGIADRPLSTREVGFMLGPRINAAGRVGSADKAVKLLLTADTTEAQALAAELNALNRSRQTIEDAILNQALEVIESERLSENRAVVVSREGWHEGVIGIVAARLVDRLHRPCVVIALKGDAGKGSGRSVTGFDLYSALSSCAGYLQSFGGHRYAAGLNVKRDLLPGFSAALNEFAAALPEEVFQPSLHIDAVAAIEEVDDALVAALERFEPFGPDNERPLFASLGLDVVGYPRRVGKDHLKLRVRAQDRVLDAIAWGRSRELLNIDADARNHLDICYTVERRTYAGRTSTQLTLRDLRTAAQPGS